MSAHDSLSLVGTNSASALGNSLRLWAEQNTRHEIFNRAERLHEKIHAVTQFFAFAGKPIDEIRPDDVRRWRSDLEARGQKPATVYARLSRLSSFYKWLMADPQLSQYVRTNPAAQARPRYPRPYQSESVKALTDHEMNRLLEVVRRRAHDDASLVGKRDYALLLLFFLTGLRRNEVIGLRGRDLEHRDGKLVIRYRSKGGKYIGREVADHSVYDALLDYLKRSERLSVLGSERPLWTRHDRAGRPGAPLSSRSFAENLKVYAREAGLTHIHIHQTRHTYARIVAEETGSFTQTQEALDHENAATTRVYVQRITVKTDRHSRKIAERIIRPAPNS